MTSKTRRLLLRTVAVLVAVVAVEAFYQLGYRNGTRDALDCDFSTVVGGKLVQVGKGSTLLRSRQAANGPYLSRVNTFDGPLPVPTNQQYHPPLRFRENP
jgi:hypothetical protein